MYGYEWTEEYGIFRLTIDARMQKEIRPVFHEELDFFGMDAYWDYPKDTDAPLLWAEGIRRYVMNGVCVAEAQGGGFYTKPVINRLTEERLQLHPIDTDRLYEVNKALMLSLEQKAITFIQEQHEHYASEGFAFVCAFSGGKDSLVLLDLCAKALAPEDFYVVFSNTGMELSDTLKAVEEAKKRWPQLRFEEAKCHMDATESWDEFGPPGRRRRWCCSVHKSVPTIIKLREITGFYNTKALVFDGVRAEESAKRAAYDEVVIGAKNISQVNGHPILKWNTAELYCYLLGNSILINKAYRYGLFRVGCMVCPLSSEWWEGIANSIYGDEMAPLIERVEHYAQNAKGKEARKYVESGGWKARVGGKGLDNGGNRVKEQITGNAISFTIYNYKQEWQEAAKILGITVEDSNGIYLQKIGKQYFEYTVKKEEGRLIVTYSPFSKMDRFVIGHLRGIANKVAYCIGCKACMVQCPTGAFVIQGNGKIAIRENICIHCNHCLEFIDRSCLVADNMRVPEGGFVNMKGLDPYHHFGLRQNWIDHFMEDGVDCFTMGKLGTVQYGALRTWLKDAEMIDMVKSGNANTIQITSLGEKLKVIGPYNPLTWAIIWAHLAYNSTICRWYCLNAEIGAMYEKADLSMMLGDDFSKANRDNAITALTDTLRQSPIGDAIQQGVAIEQGKNTYSYLRAGWEMPHAVALLYSLYLYAEHTGRRSFTFSELISAKNNPDATGMSPSDIYGIDVKAFREQVQGLAISFPKYIRVSFISNLDNIILEDFSSLDILDLAEE